MKFVTVAEGFSRIESLSGRLAITTELAGLFEKADAQEARVLAYLCLGVLRPPYEGTQFNIAEKTVMSMMGEIFGLPRSEVESGVAICGDVGTFVAQKIVCNPQERSLLEVYHDLLGIEVVEGTGAQKQRCELLYRLACSMRPVEVRFVMRIVLGMLRLNFSDMTVLDALSFMLAGDKSVRPVIENAYNVCVDIGRIAQVAKEAGTAGIEKISIEVGVPVRPAAAERLSSAQAIIEKIGVGCAQPKIDGFRLQIHLDFRHKNHKKYRFFSRNLIDMSALFPDLVAELLALPVETAIFEGEAVAFDEETGEFLPFQETVKRRRKHGIAAASEALPIKLYLFDCMYLDGQSLLEKPHHERRAVLERFITNGSTRAISSRVYVIEERCVRDAQVLEDYFWKNVSQGFEGLVVKRPDSVYTPGKRNFNWIKLKRQETGVLDDTIDTVILGYYAGKGKRAQFGIGSFLVGVYNKALDRFETIAKVGTGLTDDEWGQLKAMCDGIAVAVQPANVVCAKELYPDVWVAPVYVVSIRADNITQSPLHTAARDDTGVGLALRFPRFMAHRPDKSALDATTTTEIRDMFKNTRASPSTHKGGALDPGLS